MSKEATIVTLKALAPRVFEIPDFVSTDEINHILGMYQGTSMASAREFNDQTLSPKESAALLKDDTSFVLKNIYKRAADLLKLGQSGTSLNAENTFSMAPLRLEHLTSDSSSNSERLRFIVEQDYRTIATLVICFACDDSVTGGSVVFEDIDNPINSGPLEVSVRERTQNI